MPSPEKVFLKQILLTTVLSLMTTLYPLLCMMKKLPDSKNYMTPGKLIVLINNNYTTPPPPLGNYIIYSSYFYRSADLDVLARLSEYLAQHVSTMEDYLMERVN